MLIAYNIVGTAADLEQVTQSEVIKFSAGGFSRLHPQSRPPIRPCWRDVFLNNKEAVLEMISRFNEDLAALARRHPAGTTAMRSMTCFSRTRSIRRSIIDLGQETDAPDFGRRPGKE